jgi:hypothetical protein
MVRGLALRA